jgi:hypothetical protein
MSGRAVAGPVAITAAAIPAVITPTAKRDRFKVVPFVNGLMLTLVHPPGEVNVRLDPTSPLDGRSARYSVLTP